MKEKKLMKISELVKETGVPASTISFYIREGLLPQPIKTGKTRAYYSVDHVEGIERIKKSREKGKGTLNDIRLQVGRKVVRQELKNKRYAVPDTRGKIILAATDLFSKKGYEETSITDITTKAMISKETFYLQFKNKEALLMECAQIIFHDMYRDVWQQLRDEKDILKRSVKRTKAFFDSYPRWINMMSIIRALAVGNPAFRKKFNELLYQMISPIIREFDLLKRSGFIQRKTNVALSAYLAMGMAEFGASLVSSGTCREDEVINSIHRIIQHGILS